MSNAIAIAGVGMHPWGKWGRNFVEYGVHAARAALADSGIAWSDVDFVVGGETVRNGYAGYVAGSTFTQALGWNGARIATSYAACATGAQAIDTARARILSGMSEVALVVGADTTPKGFLAPNAGERWNDPDWLRFRLLGMTNPAYFALYARRRMDLYGATSEDFAQVKVKNAKHGLDNPNARYRKESSVEDVLASPVVSDPLRLLDICATSDGAAAMVLTSLDYAKKHGLVDPVRVEAVSTVTPTFPNTVIDMPLLATDSSAVTGVPEHTFKESIALAAYEEAGIEPSDVDVARSTTCRPRSSWTGSKTCSSALAVRPRPCCVLVTPPSAGGSRSTPRADWPASGKPCPPRRSLRSANWCGSCAARRPAARSTAPAWASRRTRASSATVRRSSSPADKALSLARDEGPGRGRSQ